MYDIPSCHHARETRTRCRDVVSLIRSRGPLNMTMFAGPHTCGRNWSPDVIQRMKNKIKSLLDIGDILSPGRSRNATGAKIAAIVASVLIPREAWRTEECKGSKVTYPVLSLGQFFPLAKRFVDKCNVRTL